MLPWLIAAGFPVEVGLFDLYSCGFVLHLENRNPNASRAHRGKQHILKPVGLRLYGIQQNRLHVHAPIYDTFFKCVLPAFMGRGRNLVTVPACRRQFHNGSQRGHSAGAGTQQFFAKFIRIHL